MIWDWNILGLNCLGLNCLGTELTWDWIVSDWIGTWDWSVWDCKVLDWIIWDWKILDWTDWDWKILDWSVWDWNVLDWNVWDWNVLDWNVSDWNVSGLYRLGLNRRDWNGRDSIGPEPVDCLNYECFINICKKNYYIIYFLQICRDECEVLEYKLCTKELAIARSQSLISHQLVLPDCQELPVIGSTENYNCVHLGMVKILMSIKTIFGQKLCPRQELFCPS